MSAIYYMVTRFGDIIRFRGDLQKGGALIREVGQSDCVLCGRLAEDVFGSDVSAKVALIDMLDRMIRGQFNRIEAILVEMDKCKADPQRFSALSNRMKEHAERVRRLQKRLALVKQGSFKPTSRPSCR